MPIQTSDTVNAVIYARYSSHSQTEQSIEGQLHDGYAYAEKNGYRVIGEYIDRALTGTKDQRPDFQRMIKDAEKRQFQVVIVWKLDRFARNRYDSATYKARLKKYGVRVVSVMENITDSPEGIILEGLLESMAEYYSANLAENIRRGQNESIKKGWFCGGTAPFGYRVENHRLVADDRTAPVVREIYARYASGEPLTAIAEDLNRRGLRTSKGRPFRIASFDAMIPNETYVGRYRYRGEIVPGLAVPLLEEDVYRRAVARREANRRAPAAAKAPIRYLLQGKAFCGYCGSRMIGESGRSCGGAMFHYYSCARKKKEHTCPKKNERKGFIEWYVCEQTVTYILAPERIDAISALVVDRYKQDFDHGQVQALERQLQRIEDDLNALVDRLIALPPSAAPKIGERMEQLEAQKAEVEIDLAKMRIAQRIQLTEKDVKAWLHQFGAGDLLDESFQQKIIDTFINSVYLYDDRVAIFFNIKDAKQVSSIDMINALDEMEDPTPESPSSVRICPVPLHSHPINPNIAYIFVHGMLGIIVKR